MIFKSGAGKTGLSHKVHKVIKFIKSFKPKTSIRVKKTMAVAAIRNGAKGT